MHTTAATAVAILLALTGCVGQVLEPADGTTTSDAPDPDENRTGESEEPGESSDPPEPAPEEAGNTSELPENLDLYAFDETVVGTSPPNPKGSGPAVEALPASVTGTFEVPGNVTDLVFHSGWRGTGMGQAEVVGPNGTVVYSSSELVCGNVPDSLVVCLYTAASEDGDEVPKGTYTVRYHIAGSMHVELEVTGLVHGSADQASDGT